MALEPDRLVQQRSRYTDLDLDTTFTPRLTHVEIMPKSVNRIRS